jgi:hypothetical protein
MSNSTTTKSPKTIRVGSNPGVYSPGLWRLYLAADRQGDAWKREFLLALTQDRLTNDEITAILGGWLDLVGTTEGETLVLTLS